MSRLDELINELCPNGVEYKKIGEVCQLQRGTPITRQDTGEGNIPVIAGGQKPAYYSNKSNRDGETITVAGSGAYAGYVSYWNVPIYVSDAFSVKGKDACLTKYVYYFLKNVQEKIYSTKKGAGVPHVHIKDIDKFLVPVPPLPVQEEIVRILDKFTELEAELETKLEAELEARRKQYEYYRNTLLTFENTSRGGVKNKQLNEITISISSGKNKEKLSEGKYVVYGSTGIIGKTNTPMYDYQQILVARVGANAGYVQLVNGKYDVSDNTLMVNVRKEYNTRYLYHTLINMNLNRYARGGGQPLITAQQLKKLSIPIPPLSEQERIVNILDKFEALTSDLSAGLPAEIKARRQQYEYYRDKLLTFKRLSA